MVDEVASVLLGKLVPLLISGGRQLLEFDDQFDETTKELCFMQCYLKDADLVKRKDRSEIFKRILSDLRELVYDIEDILADCQLLFHRKHQWDTPKLQSYFSPTLIKSRHRIGKRLRKINQLIRKVKEKMNAYLTSAPQSTGKKEDGGNISLTYPNLLDEDEMVGLEDDLAKIRSWILEADGPLAKTTLAQKICHVQCEREKKCF